MTDKIITAALVGNPNCGKTTLLNKVARAHEAVGNYPRVTVAPRDYDIVHGGRGIRLVDLPGIYSMSSQSPEERAGRDFIHFNRPDVIVNILDAGNLDRSLFLTTQLIEMDVPRVHVLNMADEARAKGIKVDLAALASMLGGPVVETVATTGEGLAAVLDLVVALANHNTEHHVTIGYDHHLEQAIERVGGIVADLHPAELAPRQCRWLAIKLLEGDSELQEREGDHQQLIALVRDLCADLAREHGEECAHRIAHARFQAIDDLLRRVKRTAAT
ncbi:MAG: 50S ribosome-binding GTPase, partial [Alphaproteobacteria bacterium]|nr:50S ribosome-binding GTPase [Alphaproteobacteria bacterium]